MTEDEVDRVCNALLEAISMSDESGVLDLISRNSTLFGHDIDVLADDLSVLVEQGRFLVIGGAGSIGQAVTKRFSKEA